VVWAQPCCRLATGLAITCTAAVAAAAAEVLLQCCWAHTCRNSSTTRAAVHLRSVALRFLLSVYSDANTCGVQTSNINPLLACLQETTSMPSMFERQTLPLYKSTASNSCTSAVSVCWLILHQPAALPAAVLSWSWSYQCHVADAACSPHLLWFCSVLRDLMSAHRPCRRQAMPGTMAEHCQADAAARNANILQGPPAGTIRS
jgi:hypothetical protein